MIEMAMERNIVHVTLFAFRKHNSTILFAMIDFFLFKQTEIYSTASRSLQIFPTFLFCLNPLLIKGSFDLRACRGALKILLFFNKLKLNICLFPTFFGFFDRHFYLDVHFFLLYLHRKRIKGVIFEGVHYNVHDYSFFQLKPGRVKSRSGKGFFYVSFFGRMF